jgi:hypothetical protein
MLHGFFPAPGEGRGRPQKCASDHRNNAARLRTRRNDDEPAHAGSEKPTPAIFGLSLVGVLGPSEKLLMSLALPTGIEPVFQP